MPFGIVGGRLYHLITSPQAYFGEGGNPWNAFKVWEGGLGIWGAIALGALGAYIGCRRQGVRFLDFVDAAAPGLLVAQAMGRFGNYFNNEIHGAPTDLPWGLKVYEWDQAAGHAVLDANGNPVVLGVFHPTFLYEAIFCVLLARPADLAGPPARLPPRPDLRALRRGVPRRARGHRVHAHRRANHILGLRVNSWVSILVFLLGVLLFVWFGRRPAGPGEPEPESRPRGDPRHRGRISTIRR